MKQKTFAVFVVYVWLKTLIGLFLNPTRSVREISRERVLTPIILSPVLGLFILFLLGRIATLFVEFYGVNRSLIAFFLSFTLISMVLWQLLILYLLFTYVTNQHK